MKRLHRRLLWLVLGTALSVVSCSSTLWDRPVEDLKNELASGKFTFFLTLKPKSLSEVDLGALGEGAAWNLGTQFANAQRSTEAELLWRRSLNTEGSPWREQAGLDLFDLYSSKRDWLKAETVAERLVSFDGGRLEFRRCLFEAYYFQKKDTQAAEILKSWPAGTFDAVLERENQLFAGVLAARAGSNEAAAALLKPLVWDQEASVLHFRLESFFQEDETRYALLGPGGKEAVAFQSLVYRGVGKETVAWFKGRKLPTGFWNHRALVSGIETAFKSESRAETGLRILQSLEPGLTGEAAFAAVYAKGRLYRTLGWWGPARAAFQAALPAAPNMADRKRTAWNWLNAWVNLDPAGALNPFVQVYSGTDEPSYFSDVFDNWLTQLVQGRHWDQLCAVVRDLGPRLSPEDRSQASFLLARLSTHGLVDLARQGITAPVQDMLESVITVQPFSYEALMARAVLARPLEWPAEAPIELASTDRQRSRLRLWSSMAALGLANRMATEVASSTEPLDPQFVEKTAAFLQEHGQYRPSLQILYRLLKDPGRVLTEPRARLLFPDAFVELATERAAAEKLDVSLLLGLMREESSFDPSARSWVGAQGLTQLMPATAAETAKAMRMKTYDLSLPADNIRIGARFLSTMIRTQGRIYLALMAYNAGGGRIRPWKASLGRLPEEIFVEGVPIDETRGYVKKILTSTVMIGVLHHGRTLDQMVRLIYPGFEP